VTDVWIVNASPLITLAKVDQIQLLQKLCRELLVPQAVVLEILAGPSSERILKCTVLEAVFGMGEKRKSQGLASQSLSC
jgi:predicted nucleic acid-binding protein